MERRHEAIRAHDDRAFGELVVALADTLEVIACRVGLADGTRGEVHDLVAIVAG